MCTSMYPAAMQYTLSSYRLYLITSRQTLILPLTSAYTDCQDKMAHTKVEARTIDGRQTGPLPTHTEEHHLPLPDDQLGK